MSSITCKLVTDESELTGAFEVRRRVFVQEQGVAEALEYDDLDDHALHVVARHGNTVIGTARVRFPAPNHAKIERMAVLRPFRRGGTGSAMLSFLKEELRSKGIAHLILHAQVAVTGFYRTHGFLETGSPFWEAGIEHMEMHMDL